MIELARLERAYQTARRDLLAERGSSEHWTGELSSSALSTATACSALAIVGRSKGSGEEQTFQPLIDAGLAWIFARQNPDGGWGDTDLSHSNLSTTMLVEAAATLAGQSDRHAAQLDRARRYVAAQGGIPGLRRRYGRDKTFAVPILANCALAGLVPWREVSPLPFEAACLPQSWYRFARLPVVSYAIPALVAIGQARFVLGGSWNPISQVVRRLSIAPSLKVLERMQPASGGYLEATPLTSFVVMSLAGSGRPDHPVTKQGVKFLLDSVRADGSWPIDTNLATWVTTLSINALGTEEPEHLSAPLVEWLLKCQHRQRHPFTGAAPGGWGWSDLSGAVPDADDTPGALLALATWLGGASGEHSTSRTLALHAEIREGVEMGIDWLLGLQNRDGGWPTFCRGWGILPFDRSGTDLTAHAIRALAAWKDSWSDDRPTRRRAPLSAAIERGLAYLQRTQRADGSWLPLWFGNQHRPDDENPLYGTARVLFAYRDLRLMHLESARRAVRFLLGEQRSGGGWGSPNSVEPSGRDFADGADCGGSTVEETALAVEALLAGGGDTASSEATQAAVHQGLNWLVEHVEQGEHRKPSPIGFYFAKLWYYERLYPIILSVSALGRGLAWMRSPAMATLETADPPQVE